jgi:hypothetical protein
VRETLKRLVELQRLDDALGRLARALEALPAEREAVLEEERQARARVEEAVRRLDSLRLEQRHAEAALQDAETRRKRLEGQQSQVKSNEAYTALLHEIDAAGDAISQAETRILELMEAVSDAGAVLEACRAAAGRSAELGASRLREIEERGAALARGREETAAARAALAARLEPGALDRYERIAERRRPAVVLVENEVCLGCRVGIPPQLSVEILAAERLVVCGSCKRILVQARLLREEDARPLQ